MSAINRAENERFRHENERFRHEIERLGRKTVAELKLRYRELFGEVSRSNHKQFLIRRVAWRIQALAEGELSERARERALSLAQDADLRLMPPRGASGLVRSRRRDSRLPRPGTTLTRIFRNRTITVRILDDGFQYEGTVYRSLSAVARQVTGTPWNGFSFFRLPSGAGRE